MAINVLHIRSSSGFFGAESVIVTLLSRQPNHDVSPLLASIENYINHNDELVQRAHAASIEAVTVPCAARWDKTTMKTLQALVVEQKTHLIHTHDFKSHAYGALLARRCRLPVVATLHGWISTTLKMKVYLQIELLFLRWFRLLVAVSRPTLERLQGIRLKRARVEYIPNGVDTEIFSAKRRARERGRWGFNDGDHVFCTVARLSQEKGQKILLDAFAVAARHHPHARLLIVGSGPDLEVLESLTRQLKIEQLVCFAGAQTDIQSVMSDVDCYVSPSLTEGMPMVVLEAMACEVPVIATAVGAVPDLMSDGAGTLVAPGDATVLAKAMADDLERAACPTAQVRKARRRIEEMYSAELQCERYAAAYARVLGHE